MRILQWVNVGLRGMMETAVVIGFGVWGFQAGNEIWTKIAMMILAPLVGFGIWGAIDFRRAGAMAETLRLIEELVISGLAAMAWYDVGWPTACWSLVALSVIHHVLVYALGGRLLKR